MMSDMVQPAQSCNITSLGIVLYVALRNIGLSSESTNSQGGCANLLFCKVFAENCMKMKEFGPPGAFCWICQWMWELTRAIQ